MSMVMKRKKSYSLVLPGSESAIISKVCTLYSYADQLLVYMQGEMMVLGSNILHPWLMFEYRGHFNCTRVILKNMVANFGNKV